MCFTPAISLTTALIEFVAALIIRTKFRKSLVNNFFFIFLIFLGFYQFTEFMLCSSGNANFWARMGFITYTFLPAIGLYHILKITNKNINTANLGLLFVIPISFSFVALFMKDFVVKSQCSQFFIEVVTLVSKSPEVLAFYASYYFLFILFMIIILYRKLIKERNHIKKEIEMDIMFAILVTLIPPLLLVIIFPTFGFKIPSIYCQFAILFTITAFIVAYLDDKISKKKSQ